MVAGFVSVVLGAFLIWMAYCFASLVDPDLQGSARRFEILSRLFEHGVEPIGFGILLICVGIYLASAKPKPAS
jgi:hypothetical protein